MGGCAGCVGPSRRDQNYRVNRLTENAIIKSRVSTAQLPTSSHQKKIVAQLNQQKRRLDQSSLLGVLVSSPQINQSYIRQARISSFELYKEPNQSPFKENYQNTSSILPKTIRRVDSSLLNDNYVGMHSSVNFSNQKLFPVQSRNNIVPDLRATSFSREQSKVPLGQVTTNRNTSQISLQLKKSLLGIPQISEQQSKTPLYVKQMRKQNGQDVLKTGLVLIPTRLQTAPQANLYKYLKDLL